MGQPNRSRRSLERLLYHRSILKCPAFPQQAVVGAVEADAVGEGVLPEPLHRDGDVPPAAVDGYEVSHKGGYHISAPQDVGYDLRSHMCMMMEDWGVRVK